MAVKDKPDSRKRALFILNEVLVKKKPLRPLLQDAYQGLNEADRAFLKELVFGLLRHKLYLEWLLKGYLKRPSRLHSTTWLNLLLALYQIVFLKTPDYAAVNEAVELEKNTGKKTSLVNAVLRTFLRKRYFPPLPEDPVKKLSIETSHPEWLINRWIKRYGLNQAEKILKINNTEPELVLRVNTLKRDLQGVLDTFNRKGIKVQRTRFSPVGLRVSEYSHFTDILGHIGEVYIQDEAAQLICYMLEPTPGELILDACAAPGGKTTHIAELSEDKATVVAVDRNPLSIRHLLENVKKGQYNSIITIMADITKTCFKKGFHRILVDAPCSSLGVIRRNPDVRYRYTEDELKRLRDRQLEILLHVADFLLPGGTLLYSVCTFEPEETTELVSLFLNKREDFFIINSRKPAIVSEFLTAEGYFLTLPFIEEMDGFFAVRFMKR